MKPHAINELHIKISYQISNLCSSSATGNLGLGSQMMIVINYRFCPGI